ncbi:YczE/YyaS/YitT family protein [Streptomyces sp. GSL17-111]|uniref:YczE/YyaS/YitT family protein n=1 Tax=Streptomyces sp. GSL17-111 TaxID=3121596 RepID=UPI0030F460AC
MSDVSRGRDPYSRLRHHVTALRGRYAVYLTGCLLFSCGAAFFIHADLGTDPLDVFALGLLDHVPLTIGIAQALVAAVCLGVWAGWNRRRPPFSPFVTFFLCGSLIDVLRAVHAAEQVPLPPGALMLVGVLLCTYGSALIIMSGIGIRAMDLVAISMTHRWRWPFWTAKGSLELILLGAGYLLGGPVGVGTVCFLVFVDTLIQPCMWLNARLFSLRNHGLDRPVPVSARPGTASA